MQDLPVTLAPGQTRPLILHLHFRGNSRERIIVNIKYQRLNDGSLQQTHALAVDLQDRKVNDPHQFTFLHPSGIVSYAILRAPTRKILVNDMPMPSIPVTLLLHGAGVVASIGQAREILDQCGELDAWTIFPSGVTTWCVLSASLRARISSLLCHIKTSILRLFPNSIPEAPFRSCVEITPSYSIQGCVLN